ncbi:MAG: hypothetical protein KL863_28660 [Rhizobium sp.]|nr:hypothetical protein [Rhizobium sp.]
MSNFARAFRATAPIDPAAVSAHLDQLIDNAFAGRLLIDRIAKLMSGSHRDFGRLGNLAPVVEGNMLEQAIKLLAAANPAMSVFADCKLPLYRSVLDRVKTTPASQLIIATAAAGEAAKSQYAPDLILVDQMTGVALLVDIKRSLRSYESSRVTELRHRMLAAGTMLPSLIRKSGNELAIHHVRVAILNLDAPRSDIANGI